MRALHLHTILDCPNSCAAMTGANIWEAAVSTADVKSGSASKAHRFKRFASSRRGGTSASAFLVTIATLASTLVAIPGLAAPAHSTTARPKLERSIPVHRVSAASVKHHGDTARRAVRGTPQVRWPKADHANLDLPAAQSTKAKASDMVPVGDLPIALGPPRRKKVKPSSMIEQAQVRVLDHRASRRAAGTDSVVFTVTRSDGHKSAGRVSVRLGYSAFAGAAGAGYGSRLRLVTLPTCSLTTPYKASCQRTTALPTINDTKDSTLEADVPASSSGTVIAALAGSSGSAGNAAASPLAPSSTWQVSPQTGGFSWSYPISVPPSPAGPAPDLSLAYNSQMVDGRTSATNNQPSWIGDGWDMWPGYIQRSYKVCADDQNAGANNTDKKTTDECWGGNNATLSLNGHATTLIKDDDTGQWRPQADDGSRVEHLTGATNGDNDGEYWRITTIDGTQYYFGRNRLPGWASGDTTTDSTWTLPVFGNDTVDPCHATAFADSWCQQAWRWNLDYVVDTHGNAISYRYAKETAYYGRNADAAAKTAYNPGGSMAETDYGFTDGHAYDTQPSAKVLFTVADRCAPNTTCDTSHLSSWPDTPWDQSCLASTCTDKYAPVFFSRKMLTTVTTQVLKGASYASVDRWNLEQSFLDTGDNDAKPLWLKSITHTGLNGGSSSLPAVTFDGVEMHNRVDTSTDGLSALNRYRITSITSESGALTNISYSDPQCVPGSTMPAAPDSDTLRCMPNYWYPPGEDKRLDYFHQYVVTEVDTADPTGGSATMVTTYDYQGGAAWHYNDNELVPAKLRTWSQWRGYGTVLVRSGLLSAGAIRSEVHHLYLRGMDGDKQSDGSTRSVTVQDSQGGTITDSAEYQGFEREQITYDQAAGAPASDAISTPWAWGPTATQTLGGYKSEAWMTNTASVTNRSLLADGTWGEKRTSTTFNSDGLPTAVDDRGDTSTAADNRCTRTTYATRNTSDWILNHPSEVQDDAVACTEVATPEQTISHTRMYYDNSTSLGAAVQTGDVTKVDGLTSWSGSTPVYSTSSSVVYDTYGRPTSTTDALGNTVTTQYNPAGDVPVTSTVITDAMGYTTTDTFDPANGRTLSSTDANNRRTDSTYDPLGRLTAAWSPGRTKGTDDPNVKYAYQIHNDATSVITTQTLTYNSLTDTTGYVTSYNFYDSALRLRQTQAPAFGGGRMITDTTYDSRGLVAEASEPYYNDQDPAPALVGVDSSALFGVTDYEYDGVGRQTAAIFLQQGNERWRTSTSYPGADRIDVDPPTGGTATTTLTDARGQTTQLRQYHGSAPTGAYDATNYTYTSSGQLATVVDPAGNTWKYTYDARGNRVQSEDPDTGTTTSTYDNGGRLTSATDARGVTLAYSYDKLGRTTGEYADSTSGIQLASWEYDTLPGGKGLPTSATRYDGTDAYTEAVTGYDNAGRPTGSTVTIPASQGVLAGTYSDSVTYNPDGSQASMTRPAVGGLKKETLYTRYDDGLGFATALVGLQEYVSGAIYSHDGRISELPFGASGKPHLRQTYSYDDSTHRLSEATTGYVNSTALADVTYKYDASGNIVSTNDQAGASPDTQCFRYDYLDRLTDAWTPKPVGTDGTTPGSCDALPGSVSDVGGPAAYWHTYDYDVTGNRTSLVKHIAGGDATTSSSYPAPGSAQPHTLLSTTATYSVGDGSTATEQSTFSYDKAGNTTGRTIAGNEQTLAWNSEGKLASLTAGSAKTSYQYDAGGAQLIRHDPDGSATLYLPDGTELRAENGASSATGTRYYGFGGATIGVRTAAGMTWLIANQVGTDTVAVDATTTNATHRYTDPFGAPRSTLPDWVGDRGFVGGTQDPHTGLTTLGAREYDPSLGRFLSADPVVDPTDPQQLNGFAYADNSPVTHADPSGMVARVIEQGTIWDYSDEAFRRLSGRLHGWDQLAERLLRAQPGLRCGQGGAA